MFGVRKGVLSLSLAAALGASSLAGGAAIAQEEESTPEMMNGEHPVAIHAGTCEEPEAEPAFELDSAMERGSEEEEPEQIGMSTGAPVLETSSNVTANLGDVAEEGHVIGVHASPEEFGTLVACGEIAGVLIDGELVIAINEVDGSGVTGVAMLTEDESGVLGLGDDEIAATVYLTMMDAMEEEATPEA